MSGELTVEITSDGKATIRFPGGGQHTVQAPVDEAVKAFQQAYGDRIGNVVTTDKTLAQVAEEQKAVRQSFIDQAQTFTEQNSGYYGEAGGETGYSQEDIQRYIDSDANRLGPGYNSVEEYIQSALQTADRQASQFFEPEEWANFTDKQKLAAVELFHQGSSDTGRTNGLSAKDIDWVKNQANSFKGIVTSPNTQAISTGSDPVITRTQTAGTGAGAGATSGAGTSAISGAGVPGFGQSNFPNPPTPDPIQQSVTDAMTLPVVKPTYGQTTATPQGIVQRPESGTFSSPLQTAGLSAVPDTITVRPQYTGTTMANLTMPSQGQQSIQSAMYGNDFGQTVTVTEINGQPVTFVPPGFRRLSGQPQAQQQQQQQEESAADAGFETPQTIIAAAEGGLIKGYQEGGSVDDAELDAMYRMATRFLGYRGPRSRKSLEDFAKSSPAASTKMRAYSAAMAKGGLVKGYQEGGVVVPTGAVTEEQLAGMSGNLMRQTLQPIQAPTSFLLPQEADFIAPTAGQTVPQAPFAESATVGAVEQANLPQFMTPAAFTAQQAAPQVMAETARTQAAQGQVSQQAQIQAAQQQGTGVSAVEAAQGTAILMDNPVQREIQQGELISGSAVDATKVAQLNDQLQAAQATPTAQATVQGQLEGLMTQFEGGQTPAWAAGAMRNAMAQLSARGLGASSLAGQAVVQAAMESALPIAQMDAQTRAQFEAQNLSNRQQTAMMAAQQRAAFLQIEFDQEFQSRVQNASRIADIANMNFTAEQQIALENSRIANTTNLQNLNNRQAMVMAEAAALANLDMANLNNRQQAAVQNAQNFLQMDLTNLNNEQQTGLFRAQQNIQALFTDQAAENAAQQFNAASENQTNQFFSSLNTQVSQFNATQRNAMDQFNVNSVNAMRQFNSEVQQQRDLFNAQNGLMIAQANAQWRQNIATLNTAAQNQSNMDFAKTINALTSTNLDQIWQRERDIMNYAFTQSEAGLDRALSILLADKELDAYREKMAADQRDARAAFGTSVLLEWMRS